MSNNNSSSKATILGLLRAHSNADSTTAPQAAVTATEIFANLSQGGSEELLEQFSRALTTLKGEVHRSNDMRAAAQLIVKLTTDGGISRCVRQRTPILDQLFQGQPELSALESAMCVIDGDDPTTEIPHSTIEQAQCAFTTVDALVARTGSLVLRSTSAGGRRLSVLPPIHFVVATVKQLSPSLTPWLQTVKDDRSWSCGTIITGPSRTADIERIIVLGAHGPKRLVVIVIADPGETLN
jgi:L-lactate utilization protein LutC